MNRTKLIVALLLFGIAAVVGYKLNNATQKSVTLLAATDPDCELRNGACHAKLPAGGSIEFSIEPHSIPLMKPLSLTVSVRDIKVTAAEIDFVGIGMNMGYNRPQLKQVSNNRFEGSTTLPVCILQRMHWEARLLLETDNGTVMAPFRFYTNKSSATP
ncbi:MAG TPA: hypothetical protein DDW45_10415 [Gammaproteobacteria bacterium]|nr:hypothetical protein [Gammaproteobacteria bacterium]